MSGETSEQQSAARSSATELLIVGASLAGLTLALACAARGIPVRVVERAHARVRGGDGLKIQPESLARTVGFDLAAEPSLPTSPAIDGAHDLDLPQLVSWSALYEWLRDHALRSPAITLTEGRNVTSVVDTGVGVRVTYDDGEQETVGAVVGADGYRSTVRAAVNPQEPFATYSGYITWRGLVDESTLSQPVDWPSSGGLWIVFSRGYRLIGAVNPGPDGSLEPGRRYINFAWFDAHRADLLRRTGSLTDDGAVVGTLNHRNISDEVRRDLLDLVPQVWPSPWAEAVATGVADPAVLSGSPISEYLPERMARGSIAIIGDAAHSVSPMTGGGYASAMDDGAVLASLLQQRDGESPAEVFAHFEALRLPRIRALVTWSKQASAQYSMLAHQQR
ncbi:FAD-dependent monooxygenase [Tsukamurella spumae]|uniref:Salicylate hydroxylase n=1 Tax=Tsukamurella spumae TaxID=44753 RepID=A0A846WXM2_9ACTN|nr:FAD-dependent monooxygenase [Tsukamurella spumae]NKY17908.1 salicylate hydroxylase [Tsukamurella spumae]